MRALTILPVSLVFLLGSSLALAETENPHGSISWDCFDCHNTASWTELKRPMTFQHEKTGFPLVGAHSTAKCRGCHRDLKFSFIGTACADCHPDIHNGQFGAACQNCHSPQNWQNRRNAFELHSEKGFPLMGVHAIADCGACHVNQQRNEFTGAPVECRLCHQSNFTATGNPNHALANFGGDCQGCHPPVAASWKNTTYQHSANFPLHGTHARIDCNSCHPASFAGTARECLGCHQADFNATTDPAHATFGFPTNCEVCHNDVSWQEAQFDHLQSSEFALVGAHATISCVACHVNNQIHGLPRECFGCHENDFNSTSNPSHTQGNFPQTCLLCHNENAWQPATFDHSQSRFPLTGAHSALQCISCHSAGYQNTPFECYACHQNDFNGAADPNHVTNNFDHNCTQCHNTSAWQPATFNHANTRFPLTGAHTILACNACHAGGYQNTPFDCYSCHQNDYNGVTDPNHVTNNYPHDCTVCHTTVGWSPASFDHSNTNFPLTGAHTTLACLACHANGYQNTPTDCYSCHQADYNGAENHQQNNYPHDCTLCHNTSSWGGGVFNHNNTQFPLTGAHTSLQCLACHANGYQNTPTDCYSCHQSDYQGVADPNHVQNNFDHICTVCHTTAAWTPATFDHSNTQFPLTGAHVSLACIACHANGYQNTPTDCYSCHQADYQGVSDPNHVQNNFDHICTVCHTTSAWTPATFDHSNTQFPLTGAHVSLACIACHANGYDNTPTDCYSCHEADYIGAENHQQNNYPHDCTLCHNTSSWGGAVFNHNNTQFPLTGAHTTLQCLACHANGYQNTPTDCYSCHQVDYQGVSDPNHVQNNFDHICTVCHSTSGWTPVSFDHANTQFPLTGAHVSLACISCHANGYDNTPTDCYACHQADYNNSSDPNHPAMGFPHSCQDCHSTTAWQPTTWNHDTQYFPIFSGRHQQQWSTCADCHINPNDFHTFECIFCHEHNRTDTDEHHQGVPGYQYVSTACYNCHPRP